ncbi:MAG: type 1 glutamine amidotransferase [Alphaproteobacteria bacterium]
MRVLVLQHAAIEHPGIFRDFFEADGIEWHAVELDEGETIPPLADYDVMWVMGGPMDTFEEEAHPWLVPEKEAIRDWVGRRAKPFIGFCLGHQLLADALGGRVGRMVAPEVGILEVDLTPEGFEDPLFAGAAARAEYFQWHSCGVLELPEGGISLARSPACACQALRVGEAAYGIQYHVELTPTTVTDWGQIPAYMSALEDAMGEGALQSLDAEAAARMPAFNAEARRLYDGFMAIARETLGA